MRERSPNVYGVSRDLWDHPLFADEAYTEKQAWAWLIGAAAWREIAVKGNAGGYVRLSRGEFSFSVRFLAEKWGWTKDRVQRYLGRLQKHDMIRDTSRDTSRDNNKVYSISNYNRFQVVGMPSRDSNRDSERDRDCDTSATAPRQRRNRRNKETDSVPKGTGGKPPQLALLDASEPPETEPAQAAETNISAVPDAKPPKSAKPDLKAILYDRGKAVLGNSAGGVITNVLKACNGNAGKALAKIEDAAERRDPLGWVNGWLHTHGPPGIEVGLLEAP